MAETNNNEENEDTAANAGPGGAGDGVDATPNATVSGVTEGTYDVQEAHKRKNTKQQKTDQFQEKVLEVLKSLVEIAKQSLLLLLLSQRLM